MKNREPLYEALRICKARKYETNFINPWDDKTLTRGKLLHVDYSDKTAEIQIDDNKITLPIEDSTYDLLLEMGNTYGITAFIQDDIMVNFSYQTLTPVKQVSEEVVVYE